MVVVSSAGVAINISEAGNKQIPVLEAQLYRLCMAISSMDSLQPSLKAYALELDYQIGGARDNQRKQAFEELSITSDNQV